MEFTQPIVIGTGASGIAVASALIQRGYTPVMIDGGLVADDTARGRQTAELSPSVRGDAPQPTAGSKGNPGEKTWFGSGFASEQHPLSPIEYGPDMVGRASFAVGGLTRVWGGTFSFFHHLDAWPRDARPAAVDLDSIRQLVPASRTSFDSPAENGAGEGLVGGSPSSGRAMKAFVAASDARGWSAEVSTVAIESRASSAHRCMMAGTCLSGCPRDSIWYAGDQLRRWSAGGQVQHLRGVVASSLSENDAGVAVRIVDASGAYVLTGPQVFVATGAISTAALLIRSDLVESVTIKDTSTAFTAMVPIIPRVRRTAQHHGLSQWWLRSEDEMFAAQIYPPAPSNSARLQARAPFLARAPRAAGMAAELLHPVIAYLDSSLSDPVRVERRGEQIAVVAESTSSTTRAFQGYLRRLARVFLRAGYLLPVFATEFSHPGTGFHFGSSLPHGTATDVFGRLGNSRRIHIVDSSVLPTLEVGSVTPTVMANAARIGRLAPVDSPT